MDSLCIVGASFAYPENCWFEMACERLNLKPINKAISGTDIIDTAQSMKDNNLFTREEFDSFATFVIMHTHNYDICSEVGVHAPFAAAYDYVVKGYIAMCQALEYNSDSKWYGVEGGKPVDILICTHWHNARKYFNRSAREFAKKWDCVRLCKFDEQTAWSMVGIRRGVAIRRFSKEWQIFSASASDFQLFYYLCASLNQEII